MDPRALADELGSIHDRLGRTISVFTEDDAAFAPVDGTMTTAQHVAHAAQTVDWFMEGAFRDEGFDLDFEAHFKAVAAIDSLAAARAWLDRAFAAARETIAAKTAGELAAPLADGPIMGGAPRLVIVGAINDHTAHHRGALTVYARLRGHVPPMPYQMG